MVGKLLISIVSVMLIGATVLPSARAATWSGTWRQADPSTVKEAAARASEDWLKLVDKGDYRASFIRACSLFRQSLTPDQWIKRVGAVRKPMGALISRQQQSVKYSTTMPGAPDGQYVVIKYDSSFEHKKSAVETVASMVDGDGQLHVSGYYIK